MLMLSSLISLLFMGLAVDATTSTRADAAAEGDSSRLTWLAA